MFWSIPFFITGLFAFLSKTAIERKLVGKCKSGAGYTLQSFWWKSCCYLEEQTYHILFLNLRKSKEPKRIFSAIPMPSARQL